MNRFRNFACLLALLFCGLAFAPAAKAATVCSVSPADLNFGSVDATGYATASVTWNWNCHTDELFTLFADQARIKMCFTIGAGNVPGSTIANRLMRTGAPNNDTLPFQIYADAAFSKVWADSVVSPTSVEISAAYPLTSILGLFTRGSGSGTVTTLHGRIPAQALAAGLDYTSLFADSHIVYRYTYMNPAPSTCNSGAGTQAPAVTFSFTARASVPDLCTISTATDLDFGSNPGSIAANRDSTSAISLACRIRSTWDIGLDNGVNASGSIRRMRLGSTSRYVNYDLYQEANRSRRWGTTIGTDTLSGTSSAATTTLTVYGRVPGSPVQAVPAGTYNDVVTVTVTY